MKSIEVNILGKRYPLRVEESEVEATHRIARYVNERMKKYRRELPQQSITTVMVMAAMSLAEEALENGSEEAETVDSDQLRHVNNQLLEILEEIREDPPPTSEASGENQNASANGE